MWELDYKKSWALKNWCFWTVVLEKTLESPLDCKEIQPVHPKGDQSWLFIGKTDVETETPILWPPDAKNWLIWKDPNAGKDWGWEHQFSREGEDRGWDGWMASLTRWTWVWVDSGSWWWTGRPAAAAAAKSLQACPTLCDPIDGSPPGSPVLGILQARTRVGCHFLLQCMKVKSESEVTQSCPISSDPMDCSLPGSSIHGISRQEY